MTGGKEYKTQKLAFTIHEECRPLDLQKETCLSYSKFYIIYLNIFSFPILNIPLPRSALRLKSRPKRY